MDKEMAKQVQILRAQLTILRKGMNELRKSGMNENLLFHALQICANRHNKGMYSKPISLTVIRAVIDGIQDVEAYMFPPPEKEAKP